MVLQQRTLERARRREAGRKLLESRPTDSKISVIEITLEVGSREQIFRYPILGCVECLAA